MDERVSCLSSSFSRQEEGLYFSSKVYVAFLGILSSFVSAIVSSKVISDYFYYVNNIGELSFEKTVVVFFVAFSSFLASGGFLWIFFNVRNYLCEVPYLVRKLFLWLSVLMFVLIVSLLVIIFRGEILI